MNNQLIETEPTAMSLREILAASGIESSYERDRKNATQRRLALFKAERTTPIPGMEVTYWELDPCLCERLAAV